MQLKIKNTNNTKKVWSDEYPSIEYMVQAAYLLLSSCFGEEKEIRAQTIRGRKNYIRWFITSYPFHYKGYITFCQNLLDVKYNDPEKSEKYSHLPVNAASFPKFIFDHINFIPRPFYKTIADAVLSILINPTKDNFENWNSRFIKQRQFSQAMIFYNCCIRLIEQSKPASNEH